MCVDMDVNIHKIRNENSDVSQNNRVKVQNIPISLTNFEYFMLEI